MAFMKHYRARISTAFAAAALVSLPLLADLYMAGDSTMCNYRLGRYPQQGWGQALGWFMKDPSKLHNCAVGGMSLKSCRAGHWQSQILE